MTFSGYLHLYSQLSISQTLISQSPFYIKILQFGHTVELQWLEQLLGHENLFETGVVRAIEVLL